ncbi:uncharacterized protein (DUF58 family) [Propioniferax innocua]|uniref:Uncharacterized protein (DUF58 family) n=2 Tax=Propioniferax innocua TaxID=1753 RepID=A0A542ZDE4_9ACTN|nr:uncharacterized protein (DUF58 family) [Propioniferax innocua]
MFWTMRAVVLTALGLPLVMLWPNGWVVVLWLLLVVLLAMLDVMVAPSTKGVEASRGPISPIRFGETAKSVVTLTNTGRRRRLRVRDVWQPLAGANSSPVKVRLDAFGSATLTTTLTPRRRGTVRTHRLVIRSVGPLGLGGRQGARELPGEVTVLPAFPSRRVLPSRLTRLRELDGRSAVRTRGQGTEFDSLRDYVRGDDVRSIDWRASARHQDLVVRTWQPERDRHVVIALDSGRLAAGRVGDRPRLDSSMDAALLLAALASRAGDRITFVSLDRSVHTTVRPEARRVVADLSSAMASIQPGLEVTDWSLLLPHLQRDALVVLLTSLEADPTMEDLVPFVAVVGRRHRVVVASVADPAVEDIARRGLLDDEPDDGMDMDRFHAMAAAEGGRLRTELARDGLVRAGATVLDQPPDRIPTALVDHYLWLKSEGLL